MTDTKRYPMWTVVLANGNDERRYYIVTTKEKFARDEAFSEWIDEFGACIPRIVSITKQEANR